MSTLSIDVWSDIACPWCWVGKRKLEAALAEFEHRDGIALTWRAFELDPSAPRPAAEEVDAERVDYVDRLAKKYRVSSERAAAMIDRMTAVGRESGLQMRFDRVRPGSTLQAHRLLCFAKERGLQGALKERLFRAYLGEGEAIYERSTLVRLAAEVGLEADEAQAVLAGDEYLSEVRAEEAEAAQLGISGVPFFVFGGKYAVSGAQPKETLLSVLRRAWAELAAPGVEVVAEGAACGPEGCE